jgi:fatty acid desaturase
MKKNMGSADRIIRVLLAVLFAYLYFGGIITGVWGVVLLVLGVVFLLTSLVGFCPLYTLVGLSTCSPKKEA